METKRLRELFPDIDKVLSDMDIRMIDYCNHCQHEMVGNRIYRVSRPGADQVYFYEVNEEADGGINDFLIYDGCGLSALLTEQRSPLVKEVIEGSLEYELLKRRLQDSVERKCKEGSQRPQGANYVEAAHQQPVNGLSAVASTRDKQ